ncbi:MAG: tRNA (adenosine(37)-N6)-dimethylallyltransferase MiaA [Roseivirga sp.]|nr:tRNA (adenosine(37)-N6)-dimethylallyltransferase MiaA [Roseivirga sp.]
MKYLIVVVGPTAVGKTALSIELAKYFETEVLSADSRQFYKEMEIGTAKPTAQEMNGVPHHFVNSRSIHEPYDVRQFEEEALDCLDEIYKRLDIAIMAGGSGLFVDAVCRGFDELPKPGPEVRTAVKELYEHEGIEALQEELKENDPEYYAQVDRQNPQRLMRALEVCRFTGLKFSELRKGAKAERPFEVIKVGLNTDREVLYQRIDHRMDLMIEAGLFEEAERLEPCKSLNALQTVGYREIFGFLEGEYDRGEAIRLLKRNSRRYAKRQLTWFKRDEQTRWFAPGDVAGAIQYTKDKMRLEGSEPKN